MEDGTIYWQLFIWATILIATLVSGRVRNGSRRPKFNAPRIAMVFIATKLICSCVWQSGKIKVLKRIRGFSQITVINLCCVGSDGWNNFAVISFVITWLNGQNDKPRRRIISLIIFLVNFRNPSGKKSRKFCRRFREWWIKSKRTFSRIYWQ